MASLRAVGAAVNTLDWMLVQTMGLSVGCLQLQTAVSFSGPATSSTWMIFRLLHATLGGARIEILK